VGVNRWVSGLEDGGIKFEARRVSRPSCGVGLGVPLLLCLNLSVLRHLDYTHHGHHHPITESHLPTPAEPPVNPLPF
jgi:hypothetical protein